MMTLPIYVVNGQTKKRSVLDFHFNPGALLGFWIDTTAGDNGDIIFSLPGQTLATPYNEKIVAAFIEILQINSGKKK